MSDTRDERREPQIYWQENRWWWRDCGGVSPGSSVASEEDVAEYISDLARENEELKAWQEEAVRACSLRGGRCVKRGDYEAVCEHHDGLKESLGRAEAELERTQRVRDVIAKFAKPGAGPVREAMREVLAMLDAALASEEPCPNGLLPDGPTCPKCGKRRGPSGVDGGTWVHMADEEQS